MRGPSNASTSGKSTSNNAGSNGGGSGKGGGRDRWSAEEEEEVADDIDEVR